MTNDDPTVRTVLLAIALALLLLCCTGGCAMFKENPSDRACDIADTAVKYGAAVASKTLFPIALADLIITRLGQHRAFGMRPVGWTPAGADTKAVNVQQQQSRSKALDGTAAGLNSPWPNRPLTDEEKAFIRDELRRLPPPVYKPGASPTEILRQFPRQPICPPAPRPRAETSSTDYTDAGNENLTARSAVLTLQSEQSVDSSVPARRPQVTMIEVNGRFLELPR